MRQNFVADLGIPADYRVGGSAMDPEWLSSAIGAIYDCILLPDGWPAVVAAMCAKFGFASGLLGVVRLKPSALERVVSYNMDAEWFAAAAEYAPHTVAMWGGPARLNAYPLGEPIVASQVIPHDHFVSSKYYIDILTPRRLTDAIAVGLARWPDGVGYLALNKHNSLGNVTQDQVEGVRLLAPHLRRAVIISDLFDMETVKRETFQATVDSLRCAVVLVDDELNIVHTNRSADAFLSRVGEIEEVRGKLNVRNQVAQHALRAAVRVAGQDETQISERGIGIPIKGADDADAVMHVMPIGRGEIRGNLAQRAIAAIFVAPADRGAQPPVDAIALLYDLSPAEQRIFSAIAHGDTLDDAAADLGIAKSTTRTHLLRVFEKTGCKRQADLVALGARLSLPV